MKARVAAGAAVAVVALAGGGPLAAQGERLVGNSAPAEGAWKGWTRLDTTFERVESSGKRRLLWTLDGKSYRIPEKVFRSRRSQRLWPFLASGDKIHIHFKKGVLGRIEKGWQLTRNVPHKVLEALGKLGEGDRIRLTAGAVNGKEFLVLEKTPDELVLAERVPGTEQFLEELPRRVPIASVKAVEILKQSSVGVAGLRQDDEVAVFGVEVGDTVRLEDADGEVHHGVVLRLSPLNLELLSARAHDPGRIYSLRRKAIRKVSFQGVELRRAVPLEGGGTLNFKAVRFRQARQGKMSFDIEVSHDTDDMLLSGFTVQVLLAEEVGKTRQAMATQPIKIPPLFPHRPYTAKIYAIHERYVDADFQLPSPKLLPFSSPEAEAFVLLSMESERDPERLRELYRGRLGSGDPAFLHLLLSYALHPPTGRTNSQAHAEVAAETFYASGAAGAEAVLGELEKPDDKLELSALVEGQIVRRPLPAKIRPDDWRRLLLSALAQLEGALADGRARRLFAFYQQREDLSGEVEEVFRRHPQDSVRTLFPLAVPGPEGDRKDVELASQVIRELGSAALDPLREALADRGIDPAPFDEACRKHTGAEVGQAIDVAFSLAGKANREAWIAELEHQVQAAESLRKQGKLREALAAVEEILRKNPKLKSARKAFARAAIPYAEQRQDGASALLLERAIEESKSKKARAPLAKLLLRGLRDAVDAVVIRDAPSEGGVKLAVAEANEEFPGERTGGPWVLVHYAAGKKGYVRADCVSPKGDVYVVNARGVPPFRALETLAERIKELDPDLAPAVDEQLGHLNAREGAWLASQGKYEEALAYFEVAEDLAPNDPRLSAASGSWWRANKGLVGLIGAFLLALVAGGVVAGKKIREELGPTEDLSGQDLEIVLEYGVEPWPDDEDDDDEDDDGAAAAPVAASAAAGMTLQPQYPQGAPPQDAPPQG